MGCDKATMEIGGLTMARRAADALVQVASPVIEVGPARTDLRSVGDPHIGPLGAMAAGWEALPTTSACDPVLVLACDLPMVTVALLRLLADHSGDGTVVPMAGDRPQPLCARWSATALARTTGLVASGERRARALLAVEPNVTWLEEAVWTAVGGPHALDDADTPDDLERLRGLVQAPTNHRTNPPRGTGYGC